MFDKILVAIGLSTNAWSSITYVRDLAFKFGSELHLLGISTEPKQIWDNSLISYIDGVSSNLQKENIITKTSFIYGNPAVEVVKYIDKNGIGLVATTTGNNNEITCPILNSIARRMSIKADIPVLTIPSFRPKDVSVFNKVSIQKILVPLDCSQIGETVLPHIMTIARKIGSSVTLLHVNAPPFRGVPVMHNEVIKISRQAGETYIKEVCVGLESQGIKADFEVIDGTPAKTILKYASQHKVDLIAMGTQSSSSIANWIFGSITKKVCERSHVPILAVAFSITGTELPFRKYVNSLST